MTKKEALKSIKQQKDCWGEILLSYDDGVECKEELIALGIDFDKLEIELYRISEDRHDHYNKQYLNIYIKSVKKMLNSIKELHGEYTFNIDDEDRHVPGNSINN